MRSLEEAFVLPRTRTSSLTGRIDEKSGPDSSPSSSPRNRNHRSSSLVALAVAAGVAVGLLFGARDAWIRTGASSRSLLQSELAEKLEAQSSLLDYALAERDRLAGMLGRAQLRANEAQERERGAASAAAALHTQASRAQAALAEALRERDDAVSEAEAARSELIDSDGGGRRGGDLSEVDRHTPWSPSESRDVTDPELALVLRRVANGRGEVMVALCNRAYAVSDDGNGGMLSTWARSAVAAGVENALVLAMDQETKEAAERSGVAAFLLEEEWRALPAAQRQQATKRGGKGTKEVAATNHSVSALKFKLLSRILSLGYSVLLSDVDVVTLRDPFGFYEAEEREGEVGSAAEEGGEEPRRRRRERRLVPLLRRDSDVEAMSDGWDPATAYGYDDVLDVPSMGWSRYAHSTRVFALNSGLFFLRPTRAACDVVARVAARVASEAGSWDQAVFNEVALLPSAEGYYAPSPRVRVMAVGDFMNSKILFARLRHELDDVVKGSTPSPSPSVPFPPPGFRVPAMVHVNYHPDKHERMRGVLRYFLGGDARALDGFPDGSEW